jgi:hypothetical protein
MNSFEFIKLATERASVDLNQSQINRVASTLKFAGLTQIETEGDRHAALNIVTKKLRDFAVELQREKPLEEVESAWDPERTATTAAEKSNAATKSKSRFQEIKELNKAGKCPKCGKADHVKTPKLRSGETVNYCEVCRVALWQD